MIERIAPRDSSVMSKISFLEYRFVLQHKQLHLHYVDVFYIVIVVNQFPVYQRPQHSRPYGDLKHSTEIMAIASNLYHFPCWFAQIFRFIRLKDAVAHGLQLALAFHNVKKVVLRKVRRHHQFLLSTCLTTLFKVAMVCKLLDTNLPQHLIERRYHLSRPFRPTCECCRVGQIQNFFISFSNVMQQRTFKALQKTLLFTRLAQPRRYRTS